MCLCVIATSSLPPLRSCTNNLTTNHQSRDVENRKDNTKAAGEVLCPLPLLSCLLTPPRIAEGQYYEAHQQLRVIAARYVKQSNWPAATDILFSGAQSLLKAGQGGSGGDLCIFLLDVFNKGEVKPDAGSKGKLLSLLRAFPKDEPTRKKFVNEMIGWSSKLGDYPAGDPEIHHVAGTLYADGE